jgi:hypothetical protein
MASELSYGPEAFPWTLYFNGEVMPKWAAMWHWWDYPAALAAMHPRANFSCDFDLGQIAAIQNRIDHVGLVESADVRQFRMTTVILLAALLQHEETALRQIREASMASGTSDEPMQIYADIRDGLIAMHHLSTRDGLAFWTNGYEVDRARLVERIRRYRLPREDTGFLEAPHEVLDRKFFERDIAEIRKKLPMLPRSQPPPANSAWWLELLAGPSDSND